MGLNLLHLLTRRTGQTEYREISVEELMESAGEFAARLLAWNTCVDMIASAIGRCEFRTYLENREVFEREHYLWNFDPNTNQSSTAFLHKLITQLYAKNEALIIQTTPRSGLDSLVVASSFTRKTYPAKQAEYTDVVVDDITYTKTFRERDVLYLRRAETNSNQALAGLMNSYQKLLDAAESYYRTGHGQHWKVHVDRSAQGDKDFEQKFTDMLREQFKPFLTSTGALLPEYDGFKYENLSPGTTSDSTDFRNLIEDVYNYTARSLHIPAVLVNGKVEATADANSRFLSAVIDPLCDQLQEEIVRKRYGYGEWVKGNYLRIDTSSIMHFDMFANAANVEKLIGSGAFTINDVLHAAGMAQIPEGWANEHYLTLNITTMANATRAIEEGGK